MQKGISYWGAAFIAVAVGAIAITGQSLWIDEGAAAFKAIQPSLGEWWQALREDGSSNLQMPLHFFYAWLWEKIFGGSEIALRAANVPPLILAFVGIAWGLKARPRWQFWLIVLAAINAFTWYYMNEARPYILLFAGCCATFACLARAYFSPSFGSRESNVVFYSARGLSDSLCDQRDRRPLGDDIHPWNRASSRQRSVHPVDSRTPVLELRVGSSQSAV